MFEEEVRKLLITLNKSPSHIIIVSNEAGSGMAANDPAYRLYMHEQGLLNQKVASIAKNVNYIVGSIRVSQREYDEFSMS